MMGYRFPEETMKRLIEEGRILFGENESKIIELKVYVKDYRAKLSSVFELDGRIGTNEIKAIFPDNKRPFDFPKPTALIEELLSFTTAGDDIVMDTFAGSGTTGHAVLKLNSADRQQRRFILVEMKEQNTRDLNAERVKRVCKGYRDRRGQRVPGLGGGFRYCELGETLFEADGSIRSSVSFSELAHHIFFTEMREPLPQDVDGASPLLGAVRGTALYLLYNGILKDKRPKGGNVLTMETLKLLPPHDGPKIVYGTACTLGASTLKRHGVTFRQIPYEVKAT